MPPNSSVPYDHHWEPRGIVITYRGDLVLDMVLASHAAVAADSRFDALRFAIVDTVLVDKVALVESDIAQINAFLVGPSITNPDILVLVVARHPEVSRFLDRYAQFPDRAYDLQTCSSMESARQVIATSPSFRPGRNRARGR